MARGQQQRVYTPPPHVSARPAAGGDDDGGASRQHLVFVVLLVALAALAVVVWNAYSTDPSAREGDVPLIEASGPFKERAEQGVTEAPTAALDKVLEGDTPTVAIVSPRAPAEEPLAPTVAVAAAAPTPPAPLAKPTGEGEFVAQIAALRSEDAVEASWRRLTQRAPHLFGSAKKDVQRADLGARGVYYRVRAGYFAERGAASRFCDEVKALGQECIVVSR